MPTVLLVRHGRTTANTGGTLAGWTPGIGLDEHGTTQARALAQRIAGADLPVCRVVSSPLQRCLQTAHALLECLNQPSGEAAIPAVALDLDERLGECRYGAWTGRAIAELVKEPLWRTVQEHPSAAVFPDDPSWPGESLAAMQHRAVRAVREVDGQVRADHGDQGVWVAVSHGDVIKAILADALGVHLDLFQRIHVDPASMSVVRYTDRRPFVLRVNDVGGDLRGLAAAATPSGDAVVGGGTGAGDVLVEAGDDRAAGGSPAPVG
ncbi:MAG: MSMEG_4193 family putative phosphomutase [Dermatophilaceae bacterium]